MNTPLERLRFHVSGAIERGEKEPIAEKTILDAIRTGDRVTIVNRFGQERTGRATLRGPYGWVLNMGGRYGTPAVATAENITKVKPRKDRA